MPLHYGTVTMPLHYGTVIMPLYYNTVTMPLHYGPVEVDTLFVKSVVEGTAYYEPTAAGKKKNSV